MAKPEQPMTATGRSASEIGFVLRRTRWRRGHEVMRDMARAERGAESEPAQSGLQPRKNAPR